MPTFIAIYIVGKLTNFLLFNIMYSKFVAVMYSVRERTGVKRNGKTIFTALLLHNKKIDATSFVKKIELHINFVQLFA